MNKHHFVRRRVGFTLIEALVTVSILAVMMAVGVPSMRDWILSNRVKAGAAELVTDLQLARAETVRRNTQVQIIFRRNASQSCYTVHTVGFAGNCSCTDGVGVACAGGGGDLNRHELKTVSALFNKGVDVTFAPARLQFDQPTGLPTGLATLQVNFDGGGTRQLRVITNAAGRPQVCSPAGSSLSGYAACI